MPLYFFPPGGGGDYFLFYLLFNLDVMQDLVSTVI